MAIAVGASCFLGLSACRQTLDPGAVGGAGSGSNSSPATSITPVPDPFAGNVDSSFASNGFLKVAAGENVYAPIQSQIKFLVTAADGSIYAVGDAKRNGTQRDVMILHVFNGGGLDSSWGSSSTPGIKFVDPCSSKTDSVQSVYLGSGGVLVISGICGGVSGTMDDGQAFVIRVTVSGQVSSKVFTDAELGIVQGSGSVTRMKTAFVTALDEQGIVFAGSACTTPTGSVSQVSLNRVLRAELENSAYWKKANCDIKMAVLATGDLHVRYNLGSLDNIYPYRCGSYGYDALNNCLDNRFISSFSSRIVTGVASANGKIVLATYVTASASDADTAPGHIAVLRFESNLAADDQFGTRVAPNGNPLSTSKRGGYFYFNCKAHSTQSVCSNGLKVWDIPKAVAIRADGRIMIAGTTVVNTSTRDLPFVHIMALDGVGEKDSSFNGGDILLQSILSSAQSVDLRSMDLLANGWVVVGGKFQLAADETGGFLSRVTDTGSLDTTFGIAGVYQYRPSGTNVQEFTGIRLDDSGRIVVGGLVCGSPTRCTGNASTDVLHALIGRLVR